MRIIQGKGDQLQSTALIFVKLVLKYSNFWAKIVSLLRTNAWISTRQNRISFDNTSKACYRIKISITHYSATSGEILRGKDGNMSRNGCSEIESAQSVTWCRGGLGKTAVQKLFHNGYNRIPPARSTIGHWPEEYQFRGSYTIMGWK